MLEHLRKVMLMFNSDITIKHINHFIINLLVDKTQISNFIIQDNTEHLARQVCHIAFY